MHDQDPLTLMIPGPVSVGDEVLAAVGAPVRPNYGPAWIPLHLELKAALREVIGTQGRVYVTAGSGHVAGEVAFQSLFRRGDRILVGNNGFFGERWCEVLRGMGCEPVAVSAALDERLDPAAFETALAADPGLAGVLVVQLETGSAILNPVQEIAALCRRHNRLCIVDAVSSLAGTPLPMDAWGVDVVLSASQKCLGGLPGLAIVALNDRAWAAVEAIPMSESRSWYLNLKTWDKYERESATWHPYPATMPSSTMLGLLAALRTLLAEGLPARLAAYERRAARLRAGLAELGLPLFVPQAWMAPVLTTVTCPEGVRPLDLATRVLAAENIMLGTGLPPLQARLLRIGHMGTAVTDAHVDRMLSALAAALRATSR
ncbi:MAG: aminotransferase class V-fold PLP-dependent enzyme [Thermoflexales bacterium]|nr:aminotransferase class V-fold PLP-dependent enzyme [Thermoflexales bacterium]